MITKTINYHTGGTINYFISSKREPIPDIPGLSIIKVGNNPPKLISCEGLSCRTNCPVNRQSRINGMECYEAATYLANRLFHSTLYKR
jgi:hypothetical protein